MSTNASTATAVPHPSHKNTIAKKAFGNRDWLVYEMTMDLEPIEALEKVANIILRHVAYGDWAAVISKPDYAGQRAGHLSYWIDGVYGLTDQSYLSKDIRIGYQALSLINEIGRIIKNEQDVSVLRNRGAFDEDVLSSLSEVVCIQITRNIPSDAAAILLINYFDVKIEVPMSMANVLNNSILKEIKKSCIPVAHIGWLIQTIRTSRINRPGLINQLWQEEARMFGEYFDAASGHDLLKPWLEYVAEDRRISGRAFQACIEHQARIIEFEKNVSSLISSINQNEHVQIGSIEYDMKTLVISRIILHLQTSHHDFSSQFIVEQRILASLCRTQMLSYLHKWMKENRTTIGECLLTGELREHIEHGTQIEKFEQRLF